MRAVVFAAVGGIDGVREDTAGIGVGVGVGLEHKPACLEWEGLSHRKKKKRKKIMPFPIPFHGIGRSDVLDCHCAQFVFYTAYILESFHSTLNRYQKSMTGTWRTMLREPGLILLSRHFCKALDQ